MKWVSEKDDFNLDFSELRVVIGAKLTEDEVFSVSGAIGYAAREHLRGESLSDPEYMVLDSGLFGMTIIDFYYDMTKSRRDDIGDCFPEFFDTARAYIQTGKFHKTSKKMLGNIGMFSVEFFTL